MNLARLSLLTILTSLAAAAQARLPDYTRRALPNGATLILLPKSDVPLVSFRAIFRGGAESEPPGLHGIASLTVELMRRGAGARSSEQLSLELDSLGTVLNVGANRQSAFFAAESLARTAGQTLAIFSDILLRPAFPPEEVRKVLAQAADRIRASKDNPAMAIGPYFHAFFFPAGHPYHFSGNADEASLARIGRAEIEDYYRKMAVAGNLILIAAGDFDPAHIEPLLGRIAATMPSREPFRPPAVPPPAFDAPRLLLVDKPDATQTYFRIGLPGISRTSPDRVAMLVANTLFGGRFTSLLNDELRVNSGLTYGAASLLDQDRLPGAIAINSYTRTASTVQAIDLTLAVIERLRQKGFTAGQVASAKAYIKGNFPTDRLETADQLASIAGDLELFGLGRGDIDSFFQRIDALTLDEVNAAARRRYGAAGLQFCLVGNAAQIQEQVKKYAARMRVVPIKSPGFNPPDF